jgi:hypothetical protein
VDLVGARAQGQHTGTTGSESDPPTQNRARSPAYRIAVQLLQEGDEAGRIHGLPMTLKRGSPRGETALIRFMPKRQPLSCITGVAPTGPQVVPRRASLRIADSSTKNIWAFNCLAFATASGNVVVRYAFPAPGPCSKPDTAAAAGSANWC